MPQVPTSWPLSLPYLLPQPTAQAAELPQGSYCQMAMEQSVDPNALLNPFHL
jgi:hypothetical protein